MNDLFFARSQMGMSLAFHIIFAVIGMAMPLLMAISEGCYLWTEKPIFLELSKRWAAGTTILFAVHRRYSFRRRSRYHRLLCRLAYAVCVDMWVIRAGALCVPGGNLYYELIRKASRSSKATFASARSGLRQR